MIRSKHIFRRITSALAVIMIWSVCLEGSAQTQEGPYPFFRSFLDGNTKDVVIKEFQPHNIDASGTNSNGQYKRRNQASLQDKVGLRLTYGTEEVGAFWLSNYIFSTQDGVMIEFEYMMMYTDPKITGITDGICMFLVDATNDLYIGSNLKYGAEGAGFGYTNRSSVHQSISAGVMPVLGMRGAYLGIALDQGYFKSMRFDEYEMRNGISYKQNPSETDNSKSKTYDTRSNITIRGAAGRGTKTITTSTRTHTIPEGNWGYPVLITRHTGSGKNDMTNLRNQAGFELIPSTGQYEQQVSLPIDRPFNISGGAMFTHPGQEAYRKAIITLERNETSMGGFKITVAIQHGTEKTTVIKDYTYPSSLTYRENGIPIRVNPGNPPSVAEYNDPPKTGLSLNTPGKLVIGFMASTGQLTPFTNYIKNLRITPLNAAHSENDIVDHRRGPATIRPLDNDWAFQVNGEQASQSKDNIDPASFRFWTTEYDCLGENVFTYTVADEGKWVYDPDLAEVMFFPEKGFKGVAKTRYDIKGKYDPYKEEKFRSSQAEIIINIADNQPNP